MFPALKKGSWYKTYIEPVKNYKHNMTLTKYGRGPVAEWQKTLL